jgi:hypothetical protein
MIHSIRALARVPLATVLGAFLVTWPIPRHAAPSDEQRGVRVDSARHVVVISLGPFVVPPAPPGMSHMAMHMEGGDSLVKRIYWPMTTQLQGLRMEILDGAGRPLPRRLIHHLNLVNFDRRQLVYPLVERMMGFGQETEDVSIPHSIGLPVTAGQRIGVYVMWDNETGQALSDVSVRLTFLWAAGNLVPRPINVMPFIIDANLVVAGHNTFDVPPGGYTRRYDFRLPVSGHLVAAGGHLHDHGLWVRLVDRTSGNVIVTVQAKRDSLGHVTGMSRELLALRGQGPHLHADHDYRLEARYDNPTADTLFGMMGMMVGLFAPDDARRWPTIDAGDSDYRKDLADMLGPAGWGGDGSPSSN